MPSDNYKWYVKYNRDFDTYYIVIDSSADDENKKRGMRKI